MEYSASPRCSAPRCIAEPVWRFALAHRWESPASALDTRAQYRCADHLSLVDLTWLPGLSDGMIVVFDAGWVSPAFAGDDERSDTVRMASHLIDAEKLRPSRPDVPPSVTGDATQLIPVVSGRRPIQRPITVDVGEPVQAVGWGDLRMTRAWAEGEGEA